VNAARGPVIDEAALVEALKQGRIAGAAIDVFEEEPVRTDNPLLRLDNVLLSPHNAGHSIEAAQNMSMVAADVVRVLNGETPEFPVNRPEKPRK
jgi:phosphoglycerate dehydrogenase-like enzyme